MPGAAVTVAAEAAPLSRRTRSGARTWRLPWLDIALCGLLVLAAGLARLPNLDLYTISFPEGIRAAQLQLMAAGYRPCVEIFCNQGPLLFYALYPTYALLGGSLEAVRSGVVIFSLVGIAATYWVGHLFGGRTGAVIAALLVALSPTYLKFSRLALAEVPAEAPAILAVGAAIVFQRSGRDRWLIAAALLTAFSLLLKPVTLAVCAPVGLAVLLRPERRWRNVAAADRRSRRSASRIPTVLIGFSEILEQVVAFRLRSREAEGRGIGWNWGRIVEELSADRAGPVRVRHRRRHRDAGAAAERRDPAGRLAAGLAAAAAGPHAAPRQAHRDADPAGRPAGGDRRRAGRAGRSAVTGSVQSRGQRGLAWSAPLGSDGGPGRHGLGSRWSRSGWPLYLVYFAAGPCARDADLMFDPDPLENDPPSYWYPEVAATLRE